MTERKRWEDMTFEEKMATVEDDFAHARAMQVQQKMLDTEPETGSGPTLGTIADPLIGRARSSVPNVQYMSRPPGRDTFEAIQKLVKENGLKVESFIHDELIVEVPEDYATHDALYTALAFDTETVRGPEQEMTLTVLKQRDTKKDPSDEEQLSVRMPRGTGRRPP